MIFHYVARVACEGRGKAMPDRENGIVQVIKAKKVCFTVVQGGFGIWSIWEISDW